MTAGRSGDGHKRIVILGSTGSIGEQALEMVRAHPDRLTVAALAAGSNAARLADQSVEFGVELLAIADESAAGGLSVDGARVFTGPDGICDLISAAEADLVVGAISGVAGLRPLMVALEGGVDCALANKEPLVAAGGLVIETARKAGAQLLPVDSEISAIFQCMRGERSSEVERILLTASGGPFSRLSEDELQQVTPDRALDHPTWRMGRKVTIDSATLANKGFEVFEVKWMFGVDVRQIEVVIHHQSIIHSMVQFHDGSVMAQMGPPDMRLPIGFALFYPDRVQNDLPRLSLPDVASLTFARPDTQRFPCLRLAISAARAGRSYPVVLNAADEVAVDAFLGGRIPFMRIPELIERALEEHQAFDIDALGDVEEADAWARQYAHSLL
ncbi:MAG TPA: 1-deoxy-D-xylulose-5-phosphate reductoisomerase [Armatimonadetes bacterium]|nr:1-deoxy-D-xylulose-5-phosphate reductoisomerase [Armatimonadota bacterium]